MPLPDRIDPDRYAIFLDFDGTLVDLAERPDLVHMPPETRETLGLLSSRYGGAIAIITGRDIATIDGFTEPLKLPIAGVHGLSRRDVNGALHVPDFDPEPLRALEATLRPLIEREDGLLLEKKLGALVLHYRQRPDLEDHCRETMQRAVHSHPSLALRKGKMIVEAVGYPTDKGRAIQTFLGEAPFEGRIPVFAGDDLTDEDGFLLVNQLDGVSIKIGSGETAAAYRVDDRQALMSWFNSILKNSRNKNNA